MKQAIIIFVVSVFVGGNRSTRRKPTCPITYAITGYRTQVKPVGQPVLPLLLYQNSLPDFRFGSHR